MRPVNILFFLIPSVIIISIFILLPLLNRKKEPFGFKTETALPDDIFASIKIVYFRKVLLFSVPLSLATAIANLFISSAYVGSPLLALLVFALAGINFLFYMQGYNEVKRELNKIDAVDDNASKEEPDQNKLIQW